MGMTQVWPEEGAPRKCKPEAVEPILEDGYVVVPVEPTEEMLMAAFGEVEDRFANHVTVRSIYSKMIDARRDHLLKP